MVQGDYNWLDEAKHEEQELDEEMTQDLKLFVETAQEKKKLKELICACQTTLLSESWTVTQNSGIA